VRYPKRRLSISRLTRIGCEERAEEASRVFGEQASQNNDTPTLLPDADDTAAVEAPPLTAEELSEVAPPASPACAARIFARRGSHADNEEPVVEVPGGAACGIQRSWGNHIVLSAGCYISAAVWAPVSLPCGLFGCGKAHVLALAVHGRSQPVTRICHKVSGTAAIQLWRVDESCTTATLRLGIVHNGGCARTLQWLPRSATRLRLGLLMAVLGDGSLQLQSVPRKPFLPRAAVHAGGGDLHAGEIFHRIPPVWVAPMAMPNALPRDVWERRVCSAAARSAAEAGSYLLAGGCDALTVLVWRLGAGMELPSGPCTVLQTYSPQSPTVWSVAWAPSLEPRIIATGLANGHVMLWDYRAPLAPILDFFTQGHHPVWRLEWVQALEIVMHHIEAYVYRLDTQKLQRLRPGLPRIDVSRGTQCCGVCALGSRVLSVWRDGTAYAISADHPDCAPARTRGRAMLLHPLASWRLRRKVQMGNSESLIFSSSCSSSSSSLVQPAQLLQSPEESKLDGETRLARIGRLFLASWATKITRLRPWEMHEGSLLLICVGGDQKKCEPGTQCDSDMPESALLGQAVPAETSIPHADEPMPLTGVAARRVHDGCSYNGAMALVNDPPKRWGLRKVSCGRAGPAHGIWLVACTSAAGVTHVSLCSE